MAWSSGTPADRFGYLISCKLFALRLQEHTDRARLAFPATCDVYRADGVYDPAELEDFFDRRVEQLGRRFDARNGNDEYMRIAGLTEEIYRDVRSRLS